VAALESAYRQLQAQYHPDRHANAPDAERRLALQVATRLNEAFQTLKTPLARARYLLALQSVDTQEETNTAMPPTFLMQQMAWREAIADARAASDVGALETLARALHAERKALEDLLEGLLDDRQDFTQAAEVVRKLKFMTKLEQEIGEAIDRLLD
jgi:molecular chaperone HscB